MAETKEEFEAGYAARSGWTVERLRVFFVVEPCDCGEEGCRGWQVMTKAEAERRRAETLKGPCVVCGVETMWRNPNTNAFQHLSCEEGKVKA